LNCYLSPFLSGVLKNEIKIWKTQHNLNNGINGNGRQFWKIGKTAETVSKKDERRKISITTIVLKFLKLIANLQKSKHKFPKASFGIFTSLTIEVKTAKIPNARRKWIDR